MTDRELLELAAKAAGIIGTWQDGPFAGIIGSAIGDMDVPWNPLRNDGQALRLAVKLAMNINIYQTGAEADCDSLESTAKEGGDPLAATRRAIVRAAAEIGKGLRPFPTAKEIKEEWT